MISTVTTITVTTATAALIASLSLLAVLTLLSVLVTKEVVSASDRPRLQAFARALNVALIPLLLGFLLIVTVQVADVLH
jgi:hypothetical protein